MKLEKENKSKIIIGASVAAVLTFSGIGGCLLVKNRDNDVMKFAQSIVSGSTMKDTLSNSGAVQERPDLDEDEIEVLETNLSALGFGYEYKFLYTPFDDINYEFGTNEKTGDFIDVEALYAFCEDKKLYRMGRRNIRSRNSKTTICRGARR